MRPDGKMRAALLAACFPLAAWAHGPQIQIGIAGGKIVTDGLFSDEPYQAASAPQRIYQIPLAQRSLADANDGWYTQANATYPFRGHGVALLDGQFTAGSKLTVSYTAGLKRWDGSAFVDPGTEQLALASATSFATSVVTKDDAPFNGLTLSDVAGTAGEHKTLYWRLLGDGALPNTASDDGVYLVGLQISTDQPGVTASDPYYFLLSKNASAGDQAGALVAATALVPEPSSIALTGLAALGLMRRRRYPCGL